MTKQTPLQRINRVLNYYLSKGQNRERVNNVKRNILKQKYENRTK